MLCYPRIFIAAGEPSGDRFGAALARALRDILPDVRLSGIGGSRMAEAGVRLVAHTAAHAGMGIMYSAKHMTKWAHAYRSCVREFNREPPDVFVPIANPAFNLRLARIAKPRGLPVCYYVSPQVWAWMPRRIKRVAQLVDRMLVILPFEKRLYDELDVDCRYVGHPLLDYLPDATLRSTSARLDEPFLASLAAEGNRVVGLFPGSRQQEINHTFTIICDAARIVRERLPEARFHVAAASAEHVPAIRDVLASKGVSAQIHVGRTAEIMKGSRVCLMVSGTATLEAAYFCAPMVVVYRAWFWARPIAPFFLHVPHVGLVNLVAGREAVPEFLKFDNDARPVAEAALRLLKDGKAWRECRGRLEEVKRLLGPPGSSNRAAEAIADCLERLPS